MRNRFLASISALALVIATVSFATAQPTAPLAKAKTPSSKTWTQPRTSDGQPDLQGIWTNSTMTPLERPRALGDKALFSEQEAAEREKRTLEEVSTDRRDGPAEVDVNRSYNELWRERGHLLLRTSLIVDPPDGRLPALTPEAQKREKERAEDRRRRGPDLADSWTDRNLAERCITRGAPKLPGGYNNNFQIYQTRDSVVILQEMIHEARVIRLDSSPACRSEGSFVDGRLARPLGGRHAGGGHHQLQRQDHFQFVQLLPGRGLGSARGGALPARRCRSHRLSIHGGRSEYLHAALDRRSSDDQKR